MIMFLKGHSSRGGRGENDPKFLYINYTGHLTILDKSAQLVVNCHNLVTVSFYARSNLLNASFFFAYTLYLFRCFCSWRMLSSVFLYTFHVQLQQTAISSQLFSLKPFLFFFIFGFRGEVNATFFGFQVRLLALCYFFVLAGV